jgi:hypothetical protein
MENKKVDYGKPIKVENNYNYVVAYSYPGPLSCLSGVQSGCSDIVDAGTALGGTGRFCDYMVLCAGMTVTIFYNKFKVVG